MDIYVTGPDPTQPSSMEAWKVAVVVVDALLQQHQRKFIKCIERKTPRGNTYLQIVSRPWTS